MHVDTARYERGEASDRPDDAWYYDSDPDGRPTIHAGGFVWRLICWPVERITTGFIRFLEARKEIV